MNGTGGGVVSEADTVSDEVPLLEELGINFGHIRQKTLAVLNPNGKTSQDVIADQVRKDRLMDFY